MNVREHILKRDNYRCVWCGDFAKELHVDHVWPRARGGGDNQDNLVTACRRCNLNKSAKIVPWEWMPRKYRSGWYYDQLPEVSPDEYDGEWEL